VYGAGSSSLDVLLLREGLGVLPWALQQLTPYARARQARASSKAPADEMPLAIQWPLLNTVAASSSSSSSSGSAVCPCGAPSCYLCTPPPPVTLQQLRLVLEVVCLTCTDTTSAAMRAPLLLALLLQRAGADVRAAFLGSADGDRLLVALQRSSTSQPSNEKELWCWANTSGALSGLDALAGGNNTLPPWFPYCGPPTPWPGASWRWTQAQQQQEVQQQQQQPQQQPPLQGLGCVAGQHG
jgi:hypothetical protein